MFCGDLSAINKQLREQEDKDQLMKEAFNELPDFYSVTNTCPKCNWLGFSRKFGTNSYNGKYEFIKHTCNGCGFVVTTKTADANSKKS